MNVIYHCFGGAHSSVMAAAIHLGRITQPEKVSTREVLALPYFDMQDQGELGRIRRIGTDAGGNSVYVLGRENQSRLAIRARTSFARGLQVDPRTFVHSDALAYVNPMMILGGSLSRRYRVVGLGRAIVAEGTRRAAPYLAGAVEQVRAKIADQVKIDMAPIRRTRDRIIVYHCYGYSYPAVFAAALHTGVFAEGDRPTLPEGVWQTLRRYPLGEAIAFGRDRRDNIVMACGFGAANRIMSTSVADFLEVSGFDPGQITMVDVSGLRNVLLRAGGMLLSHHVAHGAARGLLEAGYEARSRLFGEVVAGARHIIPALDPSRPAGG
ncbi:MAG: DUF3189 family protein [Bacillota bacterium]|nr:DUF3189 family protein [Bacillota bacterium]